LITQKACLILIPVYPSLFSAQQFWQGKRIGTVRRRNLHRVDDLLVDDRASAHLDALFMQVSVHRFEQLLIQLLLAQQMAELACRRFIRCRLSTQVNSGELRIAAESYNASSTAGSNGLNHSCSNY
jgi:hypothetical protein